MADIGVILGVLHMDFLAKNVAILNCQLGPLEVAGQVISCHEHRPDEDGQVIVDETTLLLLAMCIMCQSRYGSGGAAIACVIVFEPVADIYNMKWPDV